MQSQVNGGWTTGLRRFARRLGRTVLPEKIANRVDGSIRLWRCRRQVRRLLDASEVSRFIGKPDEYWRERIRMVLSDPDNAVIQRDPLAGAIEGPLVVMHNGIRVAALSYYGGGALNMLIENKGVHEPQEEAVFQQVLPYMGSGAVMVELGAYWGFYSLWFKSKVPDARCFLVEANGMGLETGRLNFRLNNLNADFTHAYVAGRPGVAVEGTAITTVDEFAERKRLSRIDLLHSDIQGSELDMLDGAQGMLRGQRVGYVFISSHSNELHDKCSERLRGFGYEIVASANLDESYCCDGVLVARQPGAPGPPEITMSVRSRSAGTVS